VIKFRAAAWVKRLLSPYKIVTLPLLADAIDRRVATAHRGTRHYEARVIHNNVRHYD